MAQVRDFNPGGIFNPDGKYTLVLGGEAPGNVSHEELAVLFVLVGSMIKLTGKLGMDPAGFQITLDLPCGKTVAARMEPVKKKGMCES